jgi:hypothetical protein
MSKIIKVTMLMLVVLLLLLPVACGKSDDTTAAATPTATIAKPKLTLNDAAAVLDLSKVLPSQFKQLDAAEEGMSNADMGLGEEFSEVQAYLSENPYQVAFAYYGIVEDAAERAESEAVFNNEDEFKKLMMDSFISGLSGGSDTTPDMTMDITTPDIGDKAALSRGTVNINGAEIGYGILFFRINKAYVFVCVVGINSDDMVSVADLGRSIENNIDQYSQ